MMQSVLTQCRAAYEVSGWLASQSSAKKNQVLIAMSDALMAHHALILKANQSDVLDAQSAGMAVSLIDRLTLNLDRLTAMAGALKEIAGLPDPIGEVVRGWVQPNGLQITQIRVPMGAIGMIYEARPNVTVDAIGLALKTGNSVVLRGSSSTYASNRAIVDALVSALPEDWPIDTIQLLEDTSRESVIQMVQAKSYLSLVIPRGGASLIQTVVQNATVPSIETGVGNCHIFIDETADLALAERIICNAKVQRPSVCNAVETILVHKSVAPIAVFRVANALQAAGVEVRGCPLTQSMADGIKCAAPADWETEFLDLIVAMRVVESVDDAIAHIKAYGTSHSEAILSNDHASIEKFLNQVDAAAVIVNASTRFIDGGEFGFGAEIGISTQKLHARGPMGLREITTTKYVVRGSGQIR